MPTNGPHSTPAHPGTADGETDNRREKNLPDRAERQDPPVPKDSNQKKREDPLPSPEEKRSTLADGGGAAEQGGAQENDHEGGTEAQVSDRTGPRAGYEREPAQVKDRGGVS